jgi:hypothetical protein
MRQMSLQIKRRINNVNIMNNNIEIEKVIFNTMLSVTVLLAIFYVSILGNMVFNIVERKTLEKETLSLVNEIGELELSFLSVSNSVDMNLSSTMGFKETKATFAIRKSLGLNSSDLHLGNLKRAINEI